MTKKEKKLAKALGKKTAPLLVELFFIGIAAALTVLAIAIGEPDVLFIPGMILIYTAGFLAYTLVGRHKAKKIINELKVSGELAAVAEEFADPQSIAVGGGKAGGRKRMAVFGKKYIIIRRAGSPAKVIRYDDIIWVYHRTLTYFPITQNGFFLEGLAGQLGLLAAFRDNDEGMAAIQQCYGLVFAHRSEVLSMLTEENAEAMKMLRLQYKAGMIK